MSGFLGSQSNPNQIEALYIAYFGRAAEGPGFNYWQTWTAAKEAAGYNPTEAAIGIANTFAILPEAQAQYAILGSPPNPLDPTNQTQIQAVDSFLSTVYQNLFHRAIDHGGELYWQNQILTGQVAIGTAVYNIADAAHGSDQTVLANKIAAATYFSNTTNAANLGTTIPATTPFTIAERNAVSGVDSTGGSVAASIAATASYVATSQLAQTLNLTVNQDNFNSVLADIIIGQAGGPGQTYTNGDVITGVPATTLELTITNGGFTPGKVSVSGVGLIDVLTTASNTVDAGQWTGIGKVLLDQTSEAGTTLTITNAQTATLFELAAHNTASLTVSYRDTGPLNFEFNNSGLASGVAALNVTGSSGGTLSAANIDTALTNFDSINLGASFNDITITGTGINTFSFGPLSTKGLTVDFSATDNAQNYKFQPGALNTNTGAVVTIIGGTGTNAITSLSETGTEALVLSGVQTLTTSFDGGIIFDGTHVTGLKTINALDPTKDPTPSTGGADTFNNIGAEFQNLNIAGPVGLVTFNYAAADPTSDSLTVTYTGAAANQQFYGLTVSNATSVTVDFDQVANYGVNGTPGTISVDNVSTTTLTVENTGPQTWAYVHLDTTNAVTDLTIEATAYNAHLFVGDGHGAHSETVNVNATSSTINILASGDSSTAFVDGKIQILQDSLGNNSVVHLVDVVASGADSTAFAEEILFQGINDQAASVQNIVVTASGANARATIGDGGFQRGQQHGGIVNVYEFLGGLNITASGGSSTAQVFGLEVQHDGPTGSSATGGINVSALNTSDKATLGVVDIGTDHLGAGDISAIRVTAAGTTSEAGIWDLKADGVNTITVNAKGIHSTAFLHDIDTSGNIGTLTVEATGLDASAWVGDFNAVTDHHSTTTVGTINVDATTDGTHAFLDLHVGAHGTGNVTAIDVNASGWGSTAEAHIATDSAGSAVGTITVEATGHNAVAILDLGSNHQIHFQSWTSIVADTGTDGTGTVNLDINLEGNGTPGTINAQGAGALNVDVDWQGGFTLNANNTGGLQVTVQNPLHDTKTTTINSASTANDIQVGMGVSNISVAAGHNTFDLGNAQLSYDATGAGLTAAQLAGITFASDVIKAGFTSGGTDYHNNTSNGEIVLSHGIGTLANFSANLAAVASFTQFEQNAAAALQGGVNYYFGVVGSNGFLAEIGNNGAHTVSAIVELVGVTNLGFGDIGHV